MSHPSLYIRLSMSNKGEMQSRFRHCNQENSCFRMYHADKYNYVCVCILLYTFLNLKLFTYFDISKFKKLKKNIIDRFSSSQRITH